MKLIAMIRSAKDFPASHDANVHPDDVAAWEADGWARVHPADAEAAPPADTDALKAKITALGGTFHHKAGPEKLQAILDQIQNELLDAPHEDAGGLSHRELNASLEAAEIEFDPSDAPSVKFAALNAATTPDA